jgi:uncharacterized protein YfdQ (DUF2303 family)
MTTTQTLATEAEVVATLAERGTELHSYPLAADTSVVVTRIGDNENIDVTDLEPQLDAPRRPRGRAILHHPADFAAYVNKLASESATTVWADMDGSNVVAVLNDHASESEAGWRDHTVTLSLHSDSDWNLWANADNYPVSQADFAEHIEKTRHTIVEPDAATLLEIVTNFTAKRNIVFRSNVRLASGDVSLTYDEQTAAHSGPGNIEVPSEFKLMLTPYQGMPPQPIAARLRYRIESGCLRIGYSLVRPDLVRRNAFEAALKEVSENLDTDQIFRGSAPSALNRGQGGW